MRGNVLAKDAHNIVNPSRFRSVCFVTSSQTIHYVTIVREKSVVSLRARHPNEDIAFADNDGKTLEPLNKATHMRLIWLNEIVYFSSYATSGRSAWRKEKCDILRDATSLEKFQGSNGETEC